jgi:4-methoxybenzoate monooxygenase (O-demethylating)
MPQPAGIPSFDIDPFSTAYFDDPYPVQEQLREAGPVVWLSRYDICAVARYEHVRATLLDWRTFSSARGVGLGDFAKEAPWRPKSIVLETDPPLHDRTRRVLTKVLSAAAMSKLRARFELEADTLVEGLLERGNIDVVADLAEAYPLAVFPDALGMARENRRFLLPYGDMVFNSFGPRNALFEKAVAHAQPVLEWLGMQIQRGALSAHGFGADIYAAADAGMLTSEEASLVVRSVVTAGVDTTVNSLTAALHCLISFPDQWQKLRADPSLARAAFEEAVRFESPVQTFFRTTTCQTAIAETSIGEGEKVLTFLGAANRDPRQWSNPERYEIDRPVAGHVGFGYGIHVCVGQLLARLEGEVLLSALARKVASIEPTAEPQRRYNNTLRGFTSMPVALRGS